MFNPNYCPWCGAIDVEQGEGEQVPNVEDLTNALHIYVYGSMAPNVVDDRLVEMVKELEKMRLAP